MEQQEYIIKELQQIIGILGKEQQEYFIDEIGNKLTEVSQRNLYAILKEVLSDEISLLIELEIRRQILKNRQENVESQKSLDTMFPLGVVN